MCCSHIVHVSFRQAHKNVQSGQSGHGLAECMLAIGRLDVMAQTAFKAWGAGVLLVVAHKTRRGQVHHAGLANPSSFLLFLCCYSALRCAEREGAEAEARIGYGSVSE